MRISAILIVILTLLSCTTINHNVVHVEQHKFDYIDSQFNPIIKSFIYEANSRGHSVSLVHLSMTFGNIRVKKNDTTVGYCARDPLGGMVIKIHTPTWVKMNVYQQEELLFHEMAHCLIGRDHCGAVGDEGPISIMYPHILDGTYYKDHREELVDELFSPSLKCVGNNGHVNDIDGEVCTPTPRDRTR